jgi:predicted RNA-binding protein YlxR (DUF448 family)
LLAQVDIAETDARARSAGTERLCVVTRAVRPVDEMIRFVAGPDRMVVPDLKRRLPGRGVWVTATRETLVQAVRRGAFRRALKAEVTAAADLPDTVERLMERAVLDALAIARKASQAVAGFAKVEDAIASGTVAALLHAADAGADGVRKLNAALRRQGTEAVVIDSFSPAHLDLAFGRPNVIHAALLAGPAGEAVLARWRSLARFRTGDAAERPAGAPTEPECHT